MHYEPVTRQICYLNPYHGGSHAATAESYAAHSRHRVTLLSLPTDGGWRWRMRGSAVTFARMVREQPCVPDCFFTTDMLDVATFRALTCDSPAARVPIVVYFFENQLTYPLPAGRQRDLSFAWINYTTCLTASRVLFNSDFHRRWFLGALPNLPGRYHDYQELHTIDAIAAKSQVLPTGIDLQRLRLPHPPDPDHSPPPDPSGPPTIIWLNRWDYDKQPQVFFDALDAVEAADGEFRLIVAGEAVDPQAAEFVAVRERWAHRLVHWGYPADTATYRRLLHQADIVVSTAIQETLGIGILEAMACGCIPILPRRLVYPDLLPPRYHDDCLYDTFDDLVGLLRRTLLRCDELRQRDWAALAAPYDWSVVGPQFDAVLDGVVGDG